MANYFGNDVSVLLNLGFPVLGDLDGDGDVDLQDYALMAECMGGPGVEVTLSCGTAAVEGDDDDADLADFAAFQQVFTGP